MRLKNFLVGLVSWRPFTVREIREVGSEITFPDAIKAHLAWKSRLEASLAGDGVMAIVLDDVCRDDRCELGRWLYGAGGQRYGGLHAFDELIAKHAHFHELACQVTKLTRDGRLAHAQHLLTHDFNLASYEIVVRLNKFASVFEQKP